MGRLLTLRRGVATAATIATALLFAGPATAATFTVDWTADAAATGSTSDGTCAAAGGGCTLRAAVQEANDTPGADTVALAAGDYLLSASSPIDLKSVVAITGEGARTTSIDAGGDSRVIHAISGAATVAGVTITGGRGGVQVDGASTDLTLDGVAVTGNDLQANGAAGGGVNAADGTLTIRNSTIAGNTAGDTGGSQASGGGVNVLPAVTSVTMDDVTIAGNRVTSTATATGGGFQNATAGTLTHVTLSGNSTSEGGQGGNLFQTSAGTITIADSILAAGSAGNCAGKTPAKQGRNLADDSSCALPAGSRVAPAALSPLGDHGGPTDTLVPRTGSPVLDSAVACPASGRDQRGQAAPAGPACDLGAAELGADLSASITPSAETVAPRGSLTYVVAVRNAGLDPAGATVVFTRPPAATLTFVNSATGTCSGTAQISCDFGTLAPGTAGSATVTVTAPTEGTMTAGARVSGPVADPDRSNDAATVTTTVAPAGALGPDTLPPALTGLLLVEPMHPRRGGMLRYTLSEDATLTLRLDRRLAGHRSGGRCTSAKSGAKCTRLVKVGTQRLRGRAGAQTAKLRARWSGRKLKPGRYRITATAADAAGNATKPRSISARVIP